MNIKYLNESFKRLYEEAIDYEPSTPSFESELRDQLNDTLAQLQMRGATNVKEYEIAFQETIENMEPDKAWWEVTDCNIFFSLFETRSPELTIDSIIAELKPEYKNQVEENLDTDYNDDFNESLKEQLEECLNKLNEATISDEDKKDSDLIRSMIDKISKRSNARFTPDEEAVLNKYGIQRNNDFKSLDVDGISLDSHVDSENRTGYYTKYNNGNKSMINYADRARKIPQRKDTQAWGPRNRYINSNDWVNRHNGYKRNPGERKGESPLVYADRTRQNSEMQEPMRQMKQAVQDRKFYQGMIDGSQDEYNKAIETARKNYDDAVRRATDTLTYRNTNNVHSRDRAQGNIDKLLKRKPKED